MGHIRDLPAKRLSVNVRKHFEPNYEIIESKEELVHKLEKAAKKLTVFTLQPTLIVRVRLFRGI